MKKEVSLCHRNEMVYLTRIDGFLEIFKNTLSKRLKICTNAALNASLSHSARGKMNCMYLFRKYLNIFLIRW